MADTSCFIHRVVRVLRKKCAYHLPSTIPGHHLVCALAIHTSTNLTILLILKSRKFKDIVLKVIILICYRIQYKAQFEALTESSSRDEIEETYNLLDWSEDQINGLEKYIYTEGAQTSVCLTSDSNFVSNTPQLC